MHVQAIKEEALDFPGPTELLRELIYYSQFHDAPEELAEGTEENWDFATQDDDDLRVYIASPIVLPCLVLTAQKL